MKNPKLISKPFAQNGQKNVIPEKYETSMESNQATWDQGFGQITMLPVSAGGLPPKGQDFNGILNQMCETIVHISKGGAFKFSADYATAINGYPKGAILQSEDEKKYYQSIIDNNKVNFNTASQDQIKTSWKLVMTDDLLDQLSKKLESSAVVQSTGTSTTSVMSQKASTDAFQAKGNYQPSGNYALKGESYTKSEENNLLDGKLDKSGGTIKELTIASGDYSSLRLKGDSDTVNIERKPNNRDQLLQIYTRDDNSNDISSSVIFPKEKDAVVSYKGESYTKIESNERYQPKGNYQVAGYSYSKSEENNLLDGKLDKSGGTIKELTIASGDYSSLRLMGNNNSIVSLEHKPLEQQNFVQLYTRKSDGTIDGSALFLRGKVGVVAYLSDIDEANNIPVGSPIPWSLATAPSGYLICNGQTFNKSTYPKLAVAYPSGKLPDLRGEFIRGADAGRGVDVGREILSNQLGNSLLSTNLFNIDGEAAKQFEIKIDYIGYTGTNNSSSYGIHQQIEGKNGNETRPRNIAFLYIVRAA
ncbi:TPA: tail fiber protein [Proteus mirabilis]|nr:tail fiber protein [Proteus mirabilis]